MPTKELDLIPSLLEGFTGQSFEGVHDLTSLAKRTPGNALRGIGAGLELIPLVGPIAGGGWRGLGDAVDYAWGNEAPAGNPNYDPNRRNDEGIVGGAISLIPFGAGKFLSNVARPILQNITRKGGREVGKKLTERSGLGGLIIGRPGRWSPRDTRAKAGRNTYTANADASSWSLDAAKIPDSELLPKNMDYYRTHPVRKRPEIYRVTMSPEDVEIARRKMYAVTPDGVMPQTRKVKPTGEDIIDLTGDGDKVFARNEADNIIDVDFTKSPNTSKVSNARELVKSKKPLEGNVGGIPLGSNARKKSNVLNSEYELSENKPAYLYSRVATQKRIRGGGKAADKNEMGAWKSWERRVAPQAARDFELESWAANAPIGGIQGKVYDMRNGMVLAGLGTKGLTNPTIREPATSFARGVGEPAVETEPSLEKRMKDEGFTPGQKRYSAPIDYTGKSTKEKQIVRPKQSKKDKEAAERADLLRRARAKRGN